jgi:threonine dehydratase
VAIPLARIEEAQRVLAGHFPVTRLVRADTLGAGDRRVYLKLESELPTASFKVRGAVYALSAKTADGHVSEVVAASTGNHGAAVAYAARALGVRATIFLPAHSNPVKADRVRALGARLVEGGVNLAAAIDAADAYARREGAFFLHDASDPDIPAGAGTIGAEIVAQLPDVNTIYVPMGDTALVRGVASAARQLEPSVQIVGVVSARAPAYYLSWKAGSPVPTETADTIADGLAVTRPLAANVADIRELVDRVETVDEDELVAAIEWLMTREGVVAEPAGAAATAALLSDNPRSGTIVVLVTGANLAPAVLRLVARA